MTYHHQVDVRVLSWTAVRMRPEEDDGRWVKPPDNVLDESIDLIASRHGGIGHAGAADVSHASVWLTSSGLPGEAAVSAIGSTSSSLPGVSRHSRRKRMRQAAAPAAGTSQILLHLGTPFTVKWPTTNPPIMFPRYIPNP